MKYGVCLIAGVALLSVVPGAYAEGFIAGLARDAGIISEDQRAQLDGANAALGNPVDHAITQAMDSVVPGTGTAVEGYWQLQQIGNGPGQQVTPMQQVNQGLQFQQPNQGGFQQPNMGVQVQPQIQQQQVAFGQFCVVQGVAYGPFSPGMRGSQCWVGTPWGPIWGFVN